MGGQFGPNPLQIHVIGVNSACTREPSIQDDDEI